MEIENKLDFAKKVLVSLSIFLVFNLVVFFDFTFDVVLEFFSRRLKVDFFVINAFVLVFSFLIGFSKRKNKLRISIWFFVLALVSIVLAQAADSFGAIIPFLISVIFFMVVALGLIGIVLDKIFHPIEVFRIIVLFFTIIFLTSFTLALINSFDLLKEKDIELGSRGRIEKSKLEGLIPECNKIISPIREKKCVDDVSYKVGNRINLDNYLEDQRERTKLSYEKLEESINWDVVPFSKEFYFEGHPFELTDREVVEYKSKDQYSIRRKITLTLSGGWGGLSCWLNVDYGIEDYIYGSNKQRAIISDSINRERDQVRLQPAHFNSVKITDNLYLKSEPANGALVPGKVYCPPLKLKLVQE